MSSEQDISITIDGQTHHFKSNDNEAMRQLPWSDRKTLIDLLENIKQAEYVKASTPAEPAVKDRSDSSVVVKVSPADSPTNAINHPVSRTVENQSAPIDSAVKASEQDVDDLMARLILEQKQTQQHQTVPDKSVVVKLILLVFAVIIVLAVIF